MDIYGEKIGKHLKRGDQVYASLPTRMVFPISIYCTQDDVKHDKEVVRFKLGHLKNVPNTPIGTKWTWIENLYSRYPVMGPQEDIFSVKWDERYDLWSEKYGLEIKKNT